MYLKLINNGLEFKVMFRVIILGWILFRVHICSIEVLQGGIPKSRELGYSCVM